MTDASIKIDGVAFRDAARADLPDIVALLADDALGQTREAVGPDLDPAYEAAFAAIEADPTQTVLLAVDAAGAVIGCLQLSLIPGLARRGAWRGQIEGVRVAASARGRRIGEQLIEAAADRAAAHGCTLLQLTSDKSRADALRFYERLGFVASHEGFKRPITP